MMSLFTPFDVVLYRFTILTFLLISVFLANLNWLSSMFKKTFLYLKGLILEFFYTLKPNSFSKGFSVVLFCLFTSVMLINFLSVWPYFFAPTSQVSFVMFMSSCFWLSLIIFSVVNNISYLLSHSIPEGTPMYLTWFLFLIEVISNAIRPITLTVRLVANILAGHLLMILLSQLVEIFSPMFIFYTLLNLVELFVAMIQSYIFCTMICLYYSENY